MHIKDPCDHHDIIGHIIGLRRCLSDLPTLKLFFYPFTVLYSLEGSLPPTPPWIFSFKTVFYH